MTPITWRMARSSSILAMLFAGAMGAFAVGMFRAGLETGDPIGAVAVAGMGLLPAAVAVACVRRLRLVADGSGLVVVNILGSQRVRWSEIVEARAGYHGIELRLTDGGHVVSKVAQKANASTWLGRRTRADEIADAINERAYGQRDRR